MLGDFNFAQFLQGENNPHSVWMLQSSIEAEGTNVYKTLGWAWYAWHAWHAWHAGVQAGFAS